MVNTPEQAVETARYQLDGQTALRMGSKEQPILGKRGDDLRIDWGYLYLAADKPDGHDAIGSRQRVRGAFQTRAPFPCRMNCRMAARRRAAGPTVLALALISARLAERPFRAT